MSLFVIPKFADLYSFLEKLLIQLYNTAGFIIGAFNTSFADILGISSTVNVLPDFLKGFVSLNMAEILLGSGLSIFLAASLVKWIWGIFT